MTRAKEVAPRQPWIQLERDLWLFSDAKLYWFDAGRTYGGDGTIRAASGNFLNEVYKESPTALAWWLDSIEKWQRSNDDLRAVGNQPL